MSSKIKYQGKIYILESEVDDTIKEKVIEKAKTAIDEVFEEEGGSVGTGLATEGTEDGEEGAEAGLPDENPTDPKVDEAISAIESILGTPIDETGRVLLSTTISDIIASASTEAPVDEMAPGQGDTALETSAPELVLHEGRIFRKIGKVADYMKKPLKESSEKPTPKAIRVGGKTFVLAESQDIRTLTKKK